MSAILKLVEKQIAMSDIIRQLGHTDSRPGRFIAEDGSAFGPCLLVSRECGSGGELLAQLAGKRLGWNVFDATIVDEIANAAHIHERLVKSVDEHTYSRWDQTWREFLLEDLPETKYLRHLRQVIMSLGYHGDVVLVGRGAQFYLPSQCGLRVRCIAALDTRVKNVAEQGNLSLAAARRKVDQIDCERTAFVWKNFRKHIYQPLYQDLVINTGEIQIEDAVEIVLTALQKKLQLSPNALPLLAHA